MRKRRVVKVDRRTQPVQVARKPEIHYVATYLPADVGHAILILGGLQYCIAQTSVPIMFRIVGETPDVIRLTQLSGVTTDCMLDNKNTETHFPFTFVDSLLTIEDCKEIGETVIKVIREEYARMNPGGAPLDLGDVAVSYQKGLAIRIVQTLGIGKYFTDKPTNLVHNNIVSSIRPTQIVRNEVNEIIRTTPLLDNKDAIKDRGFVLISAENTGLENRLVEAVHNSSADIYPLVVRNDYTVNGTRFTLEQLLALAQHKNCLMAITDITSILNHIMLTTKKHRFVFIKDTVWPVPINEEYTTLVDPNRLEETLDQIDLGIIIVAQSEKPSRYLVKQT